MANPEFRLIRDFHPLPTAPCCFLESNPETLPGGHGEVHPFPPLILAVLGSPRDGYRHLLVLGNIVLPNLA